MIGSRAWLAPCVLLLIAAAVLVAGYLARDSLRDLVVSSLIYDSRAEWEFVKLREQLDKEELQEAAARERCMTIARDNPASRVEVEAYAFVANSWPGTTHAEAALLELQRAMQTMSIEDLATCLDRTSMGHGDRWRPLAAILRARVELEPDQPRAAKLLSKAALILRPTERDEAAPDELIRIADVVRDRYATSPDLANFCETVSNLGHPAGWMRPFERHVRHISEVNPDRMVQCSAHFALATIVRAQGIERQDEAKRLYQTFLSKFDGKTSYNAQGVEQQLRKQAEQTLKIIATHGLGMPAPVTQGVDLDGNEVSLDTYLGRVVLVSFWATWCDPCMRAIAHERELLAHFGPSDFAILGMNADDDVDQAKAAVKEHGITWRSLHLQNSEFANTWTVSGYPTFCLLDRDGVVAGWWTGLPPDAELKAVIQGLIDGPSTR